MNPPPYRLEVTLEAETGHHVVRIHLVDPSFTFPERLGLLVGDAVHNLRSALDHAVWQLAGASASRVNQFPIFEAVKRFADAEPNYLRGVSEAARRIIESEQPYHDPPTGLSILMIRRMDNIDKHRVIHGAIGAAPFIPPEFEGVASATGKYVADFRLLEDGAEIYRITNFEPTSSKFAITSDFKFTVLFGDPVEDMATMLQSTDRAAASHADLRIAAREVGRIIDRLAALA